MGYFPLFINLEHKRIIVVGGGSVAYRKITTLLSFADQISVYAKELCEQLQEYVNKYSGVCWVGEKPTKEQIMQADMVLAATNDRQENRRIADICHKAGILVNVADEKEECSFFFPSVVTRGDLTVGISSGGTSPAFCKKVRQEIERWLPVEYSEKVKQVGRVKKKIKVGSRGSKLALIQTEMVIEELKKHYPETTFETVILTTKGDKILDKPLVEFGGKGVFIEEFEKAIQEGIIDLAVHSAKDLPMALGEGLMIGGVLKREDARDVLVVKKGYPLYERAQCANGEAPKMCIGTGSLRRRLFAKRKWNCRCTGMRGNVPTRLEKMKAGECDGVILAAAGLKRLNLEKENEYDYHYLHPHECVPAGCQGIIAVECRKEDAQIRQMLQTIHHEDTGILFGIEREVLELLQADCHQMVAVYAWFEERTIGVEIAYEKNGCYYRTICHEPVERWHTLAKKAVKNLEESPWYI